MANLSYTLTDYTTAPAKTFWLPEDSIRKNLEPGMLAKLTFKYNLPTDLGGERMWVKVTRDRGDGSYVGWLKNHLIASDDLRYGDTVIFNWYHVIDVNIDAGTECSTLPFREVWIYAAALGMCDGVDGAEYQRALREHGCTDDTPVCSVHGLESDEEVANG